MDLAERIRTIFELGGWAMWPLLVLSILSVTLSVERAAFWFSTNSARRDRRIARITASIRANDWQDAANRADRDRSIYGDFIKAVLTARGAGLQTTDSLALERAEALRPRIERFSAIHAAIITAAPMIGILGTVTGIISSFRLIGGADPISDPSIVAEGIAEALFTTAFGLGVALVTLFPHAVFKAHTERALSRLETLAATCTEMNRITPPQTPSKLDEAAQK